MTAIVSISLQGNALALRLKNFFPEASCYTLKKWANEKQQAIPGRLQSFCALLFEDYEAIIFIMATGIVVRSIAPWINDKTKDPAVIVVDDAGKNVISLLSGHLGGANALALQIAEWIQAHPVITTSSDVNNLPSVDMMAKQKGLLIGSMHDAKVITSMIINRQKVELEDNDGYLSKSILPSFDGETEGWIIVSNKKKIECDRPFIQLIPQNICVGIGCKRDTEPDKLWDFFQDIAEKLNLNTKAVYSVSSIDVKADELAILQLIQQLNCESHFYSAKELSQVDHLFEGSEFVKQTVGVASVSTTSAFLAGKQQGDFLIKKEIKDGMTISIFQKDKTTKKRDNKIRDKR